MAFRNLKLNQRGYTLVELTVATAILAVMATTVITANRFVTRQSVINSDQTFATEKAIQMYEELRALVNGNEQEGVAVLDDYSNHANFDTVLTTDTHVDTGLSTANPGDPLSGNVKTDGYWRYIRQIEVNRVANDTYARQVTVKVFLYPGDYAANNQTQPGILLATVGGIMRTSAKPYSPTQVMDLYILQVNSIPSWWAVLPTLAGYMQSDISDLANRLQGLQLRVHYITRSSYGRDYYYQPSTNSVNNGSETTASKWVYLYPGFVPQDSGSDNWYYDPQTSGDPNSLLMDGNVMVDGTSYPITQSQFQGNATGVFTGGYSVADQYNNAMRYPDELAAYYAVTQAAAQAEAQGVSVPAGVTEISERMLLEGMLSQPASFENSMIINLHGELLPLPPLRDYSDAAKDPGNQMALDNAPVTCNITSPTTGNTNVRVVTHPELIYYPGAANTSNSVTVRLRVYAYYDSEDTGGVFPAGDPRVPAISLFFPDAAAKVVGVTAIVGNSSSPWTYGYSTPTGPYTAPYSGAVPGDDPAASSPMSLSVSSVGGGDQTLITLYNTPLRCGQAINAPTPNPNVVVDGGGANPNVIPNAPPTNTRTNTRTVTSTPTITGTFTPTPTFTNGPCSIVFDSATTISTSAKAVTFAHTVSGINNLLLVQVNIQDGGTTDTVKWATYAGVTMTKAVGFQDTVGGDHGDLETWYLANPATGTNNVAVSTTSNQSYQLHVGAISYQGVNQSSPIGATATVVNQGAGAGSSHFIPITTTYPYSWIVGTVEYNGSDFISPGAGQNQRWQEQDNDYSEGDDETTTAPGNYTLNYTSSGSHSADLEAVEIIPCYIGPTPTSTKTNTPAPLIPTNTPTFTATPNYTPTKTNTPGPAPGEGGLNSGDRLYGEEYIPCAPDVQSGTALTSATYQNNSYTFTSQDLTSTLKGSDNPKNTARWIISIAMPVTSILANPQTINGVPYTAGATIAGQHSIETRLGNGVTTSAVTIGASPVTIYPNLSRTYVWCGDAFMPPYTEQYQFMGDPRDCPYYDVKFGGVSIAGAAVTIGPNAYNWWFKNGTSGEMYADGYQGFGASGNNNYWPGTANVQVDLPRFYQIVRQGLLNTTSIWTGTNGWSWFYYGVGGEVGFDQSPMSNGVCMISDPFQTSTAGAAVKGYNAMYEGDGSWGKGLWVASNVKGSNSVTWYQRSWLGELYPDASYLDSWVSYGNLPSVAHASGLPETFYLEPMGSVQTAGPSGNSDDGFNGNTFWPNPGSFGSESFYNGSNTTTNGTFEHNDGGANGTELSLGVTTYNIFPFPLPDIVNVNRQWDLSGGDPPEWNDSPYNLAAMRTYLDIPTVTSSPFTGSAKTVSRLFYDYNQNGSLPTVSPYGSGVIRMTLKNSGVTQVGYVVETGTAPSGSVGAQTLAETALVYAMRTFLDGGQMAATGAPGHITQVPLVKIFLASDVPQYSESQTIAFTVASPVTATSAGGGAVSVGMPVTDIWWRFNSNGLANYYTEEYPDYGAPMTTETGLYQEAATVIYNLKYSSNGGQSWKFVQDDSAAVTGVCNSSASYAVTNAAPWVYDWPVSTGTRVLSQGDYQLMVEAYRQNYGEHYAYDIQDLEISW